MLISRGSRFVFIHIQKTGGKSVESVLKRHVPDAANVLGTHDHAAWAKPHYETVWDDYFKFAFVRNPWDRLVSWYSMIEAQTAPASWRERVLRRRQPRLDRRLWDYVKRNARSFDEFVRACTAVVDDVDGRKSFAYNQVDYLADGSGAWLVDFVGRYESLERDAGRVFERLGLSGLALPHINASRHRPYVEYYTPATRRIVADRFARDIEAFDYRFDET